MRMLDTIGRDLAQGARVARGRPGFAAAVVLTLAVGIGGNTAIFGVIRSVVLDPLPYAESERLFSPFEVHASGASRLPSYPTFQDWRSRADVFDDLSFARGAPVTYRTEDASGLLLGAFVTERFFAMLGMPAEMGRVLIEDDFLVDAEGALVVSHRAWSTWFGSDPQILGRTVVVDDQPFTVVGVMPERFAYPDWGADNDLWMAISRLPPGELVALEQRGFHADSRILARVRADLSIGEAETRLEALSAALAEEYPTEYAGWSGIRFDSLKEMEIGGVRDRLFALWAAVLLVMLICCLNLANLYLVHGASRRREYAIRAALGADRRRVFRQLFTETLLFSFAGGALGTGLASFGVAWAKAGPLASIPRAGELQLDAGAIVLAGGVSLATALLFAGTAAARTRATDLRSGAGGSSDRAGWSARIPAWVQSAQVGVTFALLVGAWLLGRTLLELGRIDPGYDPTNLVLVPIQPPSPAYDEEEAALDLYSGIVRAVSAVPRVSAVGLTNHGPGGLAGAPTAAAVGRTPDGGEDDISVLYRTVSAGYFDAIGTPVIAGREFTAQDVLGPKGPVLVNETLAARWGSSSPIGQTLGVREGASSRPDFGTPFLGRVIGVVSDLDPSETGGQSVPIVYVPSSHSVWGQARLLVRVEDTAPDVLVAIEEAVRGVDPTIPLSGPFVRIQRLEDVRAARTADERLNAGLVGLFATVALLLALIGMYGVVAYTVTLRTRAIGVRLALGDTPHGVVERVLWSVARMTAVGLLVGVGLALLLARAVEGLLYRVDPVEIPAYVTVALVLSLLALAAGAVPALRAGRLHPATVLRAE